MWNNILRNTLIGLIIIFGLIILNITTLGIQISDIMPEKKTENNNKLNQNSVNSRMTYGRFLDYLEMGWIEQVDLYDNSRNAIVKASSPELGNRPQIIRVEIPVGTSQLIQKLKEYNIDFDSHPTENQNVWVTLASNVLLPIIFIAGLFYLFQNSKNFPGNSDSSPMNIGKSTARFERRPDTGVGFDDIAGIAEKPEVSFVRCRHRS
mgnify:FL=1